MADLRRCLVFFASFSIVVAVGTPSFADAPPTDVRFAGPRGAVIETRRADGDWSILCVAPCSFDVPDDYDGEYRVRANGRVAPVSIGHAPGRIVRIRYDDSRPGKTALGVGAGIAGAAGIALLLIGLVDAAAGSLTLTLGGDGATTRARRQRSRRQRQRTPTARTGTLRRAPPTKPGTGADRPSSSAASRSWGSRGSSRRPPRF